MPEWRALVRARVAAAGLNPATEIDVVEELMQHVEDRYAQGLSEGLTEAEAVARGLEELDGQEWLTALSDALPTDDR